MNQSKLVVIALALVASFANHCAILSVRAQSEFGNRSTAPIQMVARPGTSMETWRTSDNAVLAPVGLQVNEQIAITLIFPVEKANYGVSIVPLDGGEVITSSNGLYVSSDGTASFMFQGGDTPGLYRVIVTVGGDQYLAQIYANKQNLVTICVDP